MAFSSDEEVEIKKVLDPYIASVRPKPEIRDEVDLFYKIYDQSVEIYEVRKIYDGRVIDEPIAKTTFNRTSNKWKVFWQRADSKWHGYEPKKEIANLKDFVKIVDEDKHSCFWG